MNKTKRLEILEMLVDQKEEVVANTFPTKGAADGSP